MSSSTRGGGSRGRGRGSGLRGAATRGQSSIRGSSVRGSAHQAIAPMRGSLGHAPRPNGFKTPRGAGNGPKTNGHHPQTSTASTFGGAQTKGSWQDRYQVLTKARDRERANAIKQGLIADPDKPRSLSEAITPVGTCQDMCAEFERVERVVVKDIWSEETDRNHSVYSAVDREPDESRMVKKFRRAAAGLEEQLPSDLRPPSVLKRTCDYLFDGVVGTASALEKVHHFVWDRTRAVRNDFSIQQIAKPEDLAIAVECYERIARFHIVSLHQLAVHPKPYDKYDAQQEREQLDRTLLSLLQYYDDSHGRVHLPNEAEFRAYCVIFQMQDPTPDLEDRVQTWPHRIVQDRRVQAALKLYAAACNTMDPQGPLKPRANHLIAQQDWERFWTLIASKQVSYLMACVAEVYFNLVRRTALSALLRAFKINPNKVEQDWTLDVLSNLLAFDDYDKIYTVCEAYGFSFGERQDGEAYLDLTSVREKDLPQPDINLPKQWKSELVESKRFGRSLPAVINGLSVKQAQDAGMIVDAELDDEGVEDIASTNNEVNPKQNGHFIEASSNSVDDDSLFVPESRQPAADPSASTGLSFKAGATSFTPSSAQSTNGFSFSKPSSDVLKGSTFGSNGFSVAPSSGFNFSEPSDGASTPSANGNVFGATPIGSTKPAGTGMKFDFLSSATAQKTQRADPTTAPTPSLVPSLPIFEPGNFSFNQQNPSQTVKFEPGKFSFTQQKPSEIVKSSPFGPFQQEDNDDVSPSQSSEKPSFAVQQALGISKTTQTTNANEVNGHKPEPIFLATETPMTPDHVTFGAKPMQVQPETQDEQHHFTAPSFSSTPTPTPPTTSTSSRKPSLQGTKPKKPSPLANSFNAEGDCTTTEKSNGSATSLSKQISKAFETPKQDSNHRLPMGNADPLTAASEVTKANFTLLVQRLADEITNDEHSGFLKQYVDFAVQQMVSSVHEEVGKEKMNAEAHEFRLAVLAKRYGKMWKDVYWSKRSAKRGRARRERARRGLEESRRSVLSETVSNVEQSRHGSTQNHTSSNMMSSDEHHNTTNDTPNRHVGAPKKSQDSTSGKRPSSSHGPERSGSSSVSGHKRLKSSSHLDDHGRISKSSAASNSSADLLKRSSFLGFALSRDPSQQGSATRSNYFRLKAMGIEPLDDVSTGRQQKRKRLDSVGEISSGLDMSQLFRSRTAQAPYTPPQPPPPQREASPALKTAANDADEALFARLAAARAKLADNTILMKSEMAKDTELVKSLNPTSAGESPSMARARAEARWRASNSAFETLSPSGSADVPAYRLRESKFVPREHYNRAIERSKEIKQARSRDTSRPESRNAARKASASDNPHQYDQQSINFRDSLGQSTTALPPANDLQFGHCQSPVWSQPAAPQSSTAHFHEQPPKEESKNSFMFEPGAPILPTIVTDPTLDPEVHTKLDNVQHDYTIQPSEVEQSLSDSFPAVNGHGHSPTDEGTFASQIAYPEQSHFASQGFDFATNDNGDQLNPATAQMKGSTHPHFASKASPVLSDNGDKNQPLYAPGFAERSTMNGNEYLEDGENEDEEIIDPSADEEDLGASYGHVNPYAALAQDGEAGESADSVGEEEEQYGYDDEPEGEQYSADDREEMQYSEDEDGDPDLDEEDGEDEDLHHRTPNGHLYPNHQAYEDDRYADGDTEDAGEYEDEEFDEDEEDPDTPMRMQQRFAYGDDMTEEDEDDPERDPSTWRKDPAKDSALQGVGGTVEEAIELSD